MINQIIPKIVEKTKPKEEETFDIISGKYLINDNVDVREDIYAVF